MEDGSVLTTMESADIETALKEAGFGRYQYLLLLVCGAIYASCAIATTTLSFVLPSAECDFRLTSFDKGKLNAAPLIGMIIGSYIWGSLADSRGRKNTLILALLMDSAAAIASSASQSFNLFLAFRFFNGFGVIGATSLVFSYFGEFIDMNHRDLMLSRLEIFWTIGIIAVPGLAWAIIPRNLDFYSDIFSWSSWRSFVAVCGTPSFFSAVALYSFFPESPRFMNSQNKKQHALDTLKRIFAINQNSLEESYPVKVLIDELNQPVRQSLKMFPLHKKAVFQLKMFITNNRALFMVPYLKNIILTCFIDFGLMSSYYTLMLWLPDLFERFGDYNVRHPGKTASMCDIASAIEESENLLIIPTNTSSHLNASEDNEVFHACLNRIQPHVYLYTLIVGVSCLPTSLSLGICIKILGRRFMLIVSLMASGVAVMGLNFVRNSTQSLILACVFESLTSITETTLFCVAVDIFPTNLRALALSTTVTIGRVGAVMGNVIFGAMIDLNCAIPVFTFGIFLIGSGLLCSAIPKHDKEGII